VTAGRRFTRIDVSAHDEGEMFFTSAHGCCC
jgi:hypothetical protein